VSAQGELAVSDTTVQLTAVKTPCVAVWFGAPTADHTIGATNDGALIIGIDSVNDNASGGRTLLDTNYAGFEIEIDDASKVYVTGLNVGDVAEYQIINE
jgi:hypothetical protein